MKIHFLTTVTHNRYLSFFRPHLESVLKHHPNARVTVIHHKISHDRLSGLKTSFPDVDFIPQGLTLDETPEKTISGKIRWFLKATNTICDSTPVVLIDCDTLIVRPLDDFFNTDFDLAYTWKEDGYPLNSGVLLAHSGPQLAQLLGHYSRLVEQTFQDPGKLEIARSRSGGVDQYALMKIIHPDKDPLQWAEMSIKTRREWYDGVRTVSIGTDAVKLQGFNCIDLNETHCAPITGRTHVIHYKSGWQRILLDGAPFTSARPEAACREMYDFWKAASLDAYHRLADNSLLSITPEQERKFRVLNPDPVDSGILPSEILAVCATAERLGAGRIIQSGRWPVQFTASLSRYFADAQVEIVAIDPFGSGAGRGGEKNAAGGKNARLLHGDAFIILPGLILETSAPAVVLVDAAAARSAAALIKVLMERCPQLVAAFIHGCFCGSQARQSVEWLFPCRAFTDQKEFARRYAALDAGCRPSLAMILPEDPQPRLLPGKLEMLSWKIKGRLAQAWPHGRCQGAAYP